MIHSKKCESEYFNSIVSGIKPFEVRQDDETCRFHPGDYLALNEIDKPGGNLTGRCCITKISYVLRDPRFVKDGFCILGIKPCAISRRFDQIYSGRDCFEVPVYGEVNEAKHG